MVSAAFARQSTLQVEDLPHLPPSERDFLVFEAFSFEGLSTRQAAERFDISQTRVMQIRKHVAEWIGRNVPEGLDLTPLERLRLAAYIASGRVDSLYCEAMEAWRQSKSPVTTIRSGQSGEISITRSSLGDPQYLLAASRLVDRQLSLAATAARVLAEAEATSETPAAVAQETELKVVPPDRDCSPNEATLAVASPSPSEPIAASDDSEATCNELEERRQAFLAALAEGPSPVHPPFTDACGAGLEPANGNGQVKNVPHLAASS